jgi:hypothetical protein
LLGPWGRALNWTDQSQLLQADWTWHSVAMRSRAGFAAVVLGWLFGIVGSSFPPSGATAPPTRRCSTPSLFGTSARPNEVHGTSSRGQLWGLALGPGHIPPHSGDELKIVWRMTGTGPLHITVTSPNGKRQPLVFGPEAHTVSNYHRPGDEWGTGIRFSAPGCWHIKLTRNATSGDVWLNVRSSA